MSIRRWLMRLGGLSEKVRRCFLHALFEKKLFRRCPPPLPKAVDADRDCQARVDLGGRQLQVMVADGVRLVEQVTFEKPEAPPAALEKTAPHLFPLAAYQEAMADVWAKADEVVQYGQASREISQLWLSVLEGRKSSEYQQPTAVIVHHRMDHP